MMNCKGRRSGRDLILKYYPGICLEALKKTTKKTVRINDPQAEILTWDLSNTKRDCQPL
jgi:hypothetical protein